MISIIGNKTTNINLIDTISYLLLIYLLKIHSKDKNIISYDEEASYKDPNRYKSSFKISNLTKENIAI